MTSAGEVCVRRIYFRCPQCAAGGYALDERLGIQGRYSREAQRLICLAGASWSYDVAAARLQELCGLQLSDTTVRELTQSQGAAMGEWLRTAPEVRSTFREAAGDVEFTTDGTCVNTTEGWQEMKLALFSKRHPGPASTPQDFAGRRLPAPHCRIAFAAIEGSQRFGSRWDQWAARLGIRDRAQITVVADGAKWIWEEARKNLIGAAGVLDFYHAREHIRQAAHQLHGERTPAAAAWSEKAQQALLERGWHGIAHAIRDAQQKPAQDGPRWNALSDLHNYLGQHVDHLNYAQRLQSGRSIGSGQVEGACKHCIGRRLKQSGARWRPRRVNRMAQVCCLLYSHAWNSYWNCSPN